MRFMVMVKSTKESESGFRPDAKMLSEVVNYNDELANSGALISAEGLHPSSRGARVRFSGDKRKVSEGPWDPKETIAGFWMIEADSKEAAIELVKKAPNPIPNQDVDVEIRQVMEADDIGGNLTPKLRQQSEKLQVKEPVREREQRNLGGAQGGFAQSMDPDQEFLRTGERNYDAAGGNRPGKTDREREGQSGNRPGDRERGDDYGQSGQPDRERPGGTETEMDRERREQQERERTYGSGGQTGQPGRPGQSDREREQDRQKKNKP